MWQRVPVWICFLMRSIGSASSTGRLSGDSLVENRARTRLASTSISISSRMKKSLGSELRTTSGSWNSGTRLGPSTSEAA